MTPEELSRLMRKWQPGERCRAIMRLYFGARGVYVAEGTCGTVVEQRLSHVVVVKWDATGADPPFTPHSFDPGPLDTSPDVLDPVLLSGLDLFSFPADGSPPPGITTVATTLSEPGPVQCHSPETLHAIERELEAAGLLPTERPAPPPSGPRLKDGER